MKFLGTFSGSGGTAGRGTPPRGRGRVGGTQPGGAPRGTGLRRGQFGPGAPRGGFPTGRRAR